MLDTQRLLTLWEPLITFVFHYAYPQITMQHTLQN